MSEVDQEDEEPDSPKWKNACNIMCESEQVRDLHDSDRDRESGEDMSSVFCSLASEEVKEESDAEDSDQALIPEPEPGHEEM